MELEALINDFFEDVSIDKLIKKYNIKYSRVCRTIKQYCKLNNIDFEKVQTKLEFPMSVIYEEIKNGVSFNQLVTEYGFNFGMDKFINYCNDNNLEIPEYDRSASLPIEEIYNKRKKGVFIRDLTSEYGCSHETLQKYLKKYCDNNGVSYPTFIIHKKEITPKQAYNEKKKGKSYNTIAEEYGYNPATIRKYIINYCNDNNLEIPKYKWGVSLDIEEIYNKRKKGVTYTDLAIEYDCSYETLQKYLKKYCEEKNIDISILDTVFPSEQIFSDRKNGLNYEELTKKYDCDVAVLNDDIINYCNKKLKELNKILKKEYQIKLLLDLRTLLISKQNNDLNEEKNIMIKKKNK